MSDRESRNSFVLKNWYFPLKILICKEQNRSYKTKLQYTIMAFSASSFRVTEEDWLSEKDLSGPHTFFSMFLLLLKETHNYIFIWTQIDYKACITETSPYKSYPKFAPSK